MILGLGSDVVGIDRIRRLHQRHGGRFHQRVYAEDELAYCLAARDPAERLAARWAAKEAAIKALGAAGRTARVDWRDLVVGHAPTGAPVLLLRGTAASAASETGVERAHLSLSHADGVALATVILEGRTPAIPCDRSPAAG